MAMLLGHVSVLDCCQVTFLEFVFMIALLPQGSGGNESGEHSIFPLMVMPHHTQVQFSSVAQLCPFLFDPINCSTLGFPVLRYLLEFAQTHVHGVSDDPTILSSVVPFSSCPESFPASGSFPISWLFTSGGQRIGASTSASVLLMNIQG